MVEREGDNVKTNEYTVKLCKLQVVAWKSFCISNIYVNMQMSRMKKIDKKKTQKKETNLLFLFYTKKCNLNCKPHLKCGRESTKLLNWCKIATEISKHTHTHLTYQFFTISKGKNGTIFDYLDL